MYLYINLKKNKTAFILYECLATYDLLKWGYGKPVAQWVCYIPFGLLRGNNETHQKTRMAQEQTEQTTLHLEPVAEAYPYS